MHKSECVLKQFSNALMQQSSLTVVGDFVLGAHDELTTESIFLIFSFLLILIFLLTFEVHSRTAVKFASWLF